MNISHYYRRSVAKRGIENAPIKAAGINGFRCWGDVRGWHAIKAVYIRYRQPVRLNIFGRMGTHECVLRADVHAHTEEQHVDLDLNGSFAIDSTTALPAEF